MPEKFWSDLLMGIPSCIRPETFWLVLFSITIDDNYGRRIRVVKQYFPEIFSTVII